MTELSCIEVYTPVTSRLWFEKAMLTHVEDEIFECLQGKQFRDVISHLQEQNLQWGYSKVMLEAKLQSAKKRWAEHKPTQDAAKLKKKKELSNHFAFDPVPNVSVEALADPTEYWPQQGGNDLLREKVALQYNVEPGAVKLSGRMPVEIYRQQQWHFVGYADEYVDMDSLLAAEAKTAKRANAYEPPLLVSEAFAYPEPN